jgi:ubiquinone/menaquinone biosynthesis C-methylase UbiE
MIEAQGDFNRPWLVGSLGTEYLPSIPDIHERLMSEAGASVADVACGVGWAAISLARAYPNITVDGFDLDESSIEIASRNAKEAGVADRVHFQAKDAADPALESRYDLAMVVEAIHDLSQPVAVLRSIREMLKPGGTLIVADERTEDSFTAPSSETERLFYAYSVLCCLPSAMDDDTSAATGTVMRRSTFETYARDAGFDSVSVLPLEHDFLRFYRLDRNRSAASSRCCTETSRSRLGIDAKVARLWWPDDVWFLRRGSRPQWRQIPRPCKFPGWIQPAARSLPAVGLPHHVLNHSNRRPACEGPTRCATCATKSPLRVMPAERDRRTCRFGQGGRREQAERTRASRSGPHRS